MPLPISIPMPTIPHKFSGPGCSSLRKRRICRRGMRITDCIEFSMSDLQLKSQGLELHRTVQNLHVDQLNALFVKVGFPPRDKDRLQRALRNTPSVLWLQHNKSGHVIAFANATGDDLFNAIIWDVVVDPSFQGCGLGKALMERLVADLVAKGVTNIAVYAEPNVVGFYGRLGFIADPGGIKFMVYRYLF